MMIVIFMVLAQPLYGIDDLPETYMTTTEIIEYYNYTFEIHHVVTEDGYILEMHRIPAGRNVNEKNDSWNKPVIFLQHGFIGSSAVWVTNLPNNSAAFVFADNGFDVWMGNVRGNKYSVGHTHLSRSDHDYWMFTAPNVTLLITGHELPALQFDFRWDEFSKHDLSSMINFVLNVTKQSCINYVGYSEGTLTMFAKLAIDQSFGSKICKFFALGPIATLAHIKGLVKTAATHFMRPLKLLTKIGGEFMPNESIFRRISQTTCALKSVIDYCENLMFQITGPDTSQMNQTRIPVYMTHLPAGTSVANLIHWVQMANGHKTQMYDFGSRTKNLQHYNRTVPPVYDLSQVNVPIYLYWSGADWLASKKDVQDGLIAKIPKDYLVESNELSHFNHFDFIWGIHASERIYKPIIRILKDQHNKTLKSQSISDIIKLE